jgi:hypothetical protein
MQQRALANCGRRGAVVVMRPPSLAASSRSPLQRGGAAVAAAAAAQHRRHRRAAPAAPCRASADDDGSDGGAATTTSSSSSTTTTTTDASPAAQPKKKKRQADSTDAVASFLTRRFGIAGGVAWLGVLTFGVVSEQVKTRLELREEAAGTREVEGASAPEVELPGLGASYKELRVGGGSRPSRGDLVVLEFVGLYSTDGGQTYAEPPFADTASAKPVVLVWGARPLASVIAPAVEAAIADGMRAGGRRVVTVAQGGAGGFGASPPRGVPQGGVALRYELTLARVSVAPS